MKPTADRTSSTRLWLLLIVAAAGLGRLAAAGHSLWFDEQASVFFSDQPFSRLWSDWMLRETNPALYYSMLRIWRAVFGSTDLAIRALSVGGSLAAIVLAFAVTRRVYGDRGGLIAAALAALSGQQLYFAEQARAYIFVLCAVLVAINALLAFDGTDDNPKGRPARWQAATIFAVAATAAIYLHTTMLLFPPIAFAAVIAADPSRYWRRPSLLLPLVAAGTAILAGAGWAIRQAALQVVYHHDNIAPIGLLTLRQMTKYTLQTLFLGGYDGRFNYRMMLPVLILALTLAAVVLDWRRSAVRLLATIGLLAVSTFMAVGLAAPIFATRTVFWISAVTLVLAAGTLARIPAAGWRWSVIAVTAALLVIDVSHIAPALEQEDWNTPVRRLAHQTDAILLVQGEAMALLADEACRRQLRRDACPYAIVGVTDTEDHYDTWAQGSFTGALVPVFDLPNYTAGRQVFMFRKAIFHSLPDLLHHRGLGHRVPAFGPPLLGPFPAAALR